MSLPGSGNPARAAVKDAARWYAHLRSGTATEADQADWLSWRDRNPANRQAWDRIEALEQQFRTLPSGIASATLITANRSTEASRRTVLKALATIVMAGGGGWAAAEALSWESWLARYSTGTGDHRDVRLADGGHLLLNTASAVDVDYGPGIRLLTLHGGEILVETAPDPLVPSRPFIVRTPHGDVRALGTRFTVRADSDSTRVVVLRDAVEVTAGSDSVVVNQGHHARFSKAALPVPERSGEAETSWVDNILTVSDWRLGDLVAELARYRTGYLRCHPDVAGLRVSGAFALQDTDRALAALERSLPVRIVRRTGFWVSIDPR